MSTDIDFETSTAAATEAPEAAVMAISARYIPGHLSKPDAEDTIMFLLSQVPTFAPDPLGFVKNALSSAEHIGQHQPWFTSGHAADYQMLHDALAAI